MTGYLETARQALKLHRKGKTLQEIKAATADHYAKDVHRRIEVALKEENIEARRLTPDEIELILSVGERQLKELAKGETRRVQLKYCGPWHWRGAKAYRVARKRLFSHRPDEDKHRGGTGLYLLRNGGGFTSLTPTGWAIYHVVTAERAAKAVAG